MDTPVQTPQPAAEPGVTPMASSEGAAFMQDLMGTMMNQQTQPVPQPVPQPVAFGDRYAGQQTPADPLANLQTLPELAPEQQIAAPQNMNEQQNHSWAAMRAQSNSYRKQAEEFRNKYNQLVESTKRFQAEKTSFGEELNKRDEQIKALQDEIGRTDLTRSPAFREKYDAPLQAIQSDIARTLVDNGYSNDNAMEFASKVLTAERSQIPDMIRELPTHVQGIIMVNAEKADGLWNARSQALDDWRTSAEGLAAVEARGSAMVNAQRIDQLTQQAMDIIHSMPAANGQIPAYQVVDPVFVADRNAKEQQFKAWVQQAPEEQKYAAMLEGFMAPKTYEMLENMMRENMELKQALNNRGRLAAPPIYPSHSTWAPPPPPPPPRPTVQQNGYEEIEAVNPAQAVAKSIMAQFMPQQ